MSLDITLRTTCTCGECTHYPYSGNITHNLIPMAKEAGLYHPIWSPHNLGFETAKDLIGPVERGMAELIANPAKFQELNAYNGWGTYDDLLTFTEEYLTACRENPNATIEINR